MADNGSLFVRNEPILTWGGAAGAGLDMAPFPQPHLWHAISKEITTPLPAFEPDFCQTRSKRQGGRIRGSRLRSFHLLPSRARLWLHGSLREFRMQS